MKKKEATWLSVDSYITYHQCHWGAFAWLRGGSAATFSSSPDNVRPTAPAATSALKLLNRMDTSRTKTATRGHAQMDTPHLDRECRPFNHCQWTVVHWRQIITWPPNIQLNQSPLFWKRAWEDQTWKEQTLDLNQRAKRLQIHILVSLSLLRQIFKRPFVTSYSGGYLVSGGVQHSSTKRTDWTGLLKCG